jgi:hypothetical protein
MQDRRGLVRHQVDFNGRLIFADGSLVHDCRVLDMTQDGARIDLFAALTVPDRVYLWESQTTMVFECAVCWRKPGAIGVRFEGSCGRVMRQAIVEACSLGPVAALRQT